MSVDDLTKAWIAGFFDGEGCVRMSGDLKRPHLVDKAV